MYIFYWFCVIFVFNISSLFTMISYILLSFCVLFSIGKLECLFCITSYLQHLEKTVAKELTLLSNNSAEPLLEGMLSYIGTLYYILNLIQIKNPNINNILKSLQEDGCPIPRKSYINKLLYNNKFNNSEWCNENKTLLLKLVDEACKLWDKIAYFSLTYELLWWHWLYIFKICKINNLWIKHKFIIALFSKVFSFSNWFYRECSYSLCLLTYFCKKSAIEKPNVHQFSLWFLSNNL